MTTLATATRASLFGTWHTHHRSDLAAHLEVYGPLPVPVGRDTGWSARLTAEIEASGLTGRGGAAFPSSRKLAGVGATGRGATVVINAMEGEPASDKDRVLLSVAPHLVLDGAELAARALGAERIIICVAADRDDTAHRVQRALTERARAGLASVPTEIARPPGRYVGGEESALVSWLDGGPHAPLFRLDKSIPLVVAQRPALIHNAETLAHIALIARHGARWFRSRGTCDAPGTTLVTVSGAVESPGVHEVALGTSLADIVALSEPNQVIRAVLVGGYGSTWVGAGDLSTPFAPGALARIGAGVGAGVLLVLGVESCGLSEAARIADYMAGESAGQCGPCVFGLPALAKDMAALAAGRVTPTVITRMRARFGLVLGRGACRHPDGVVRMLSSALTVFADDVAAHVGGRPCLRDSGPSSAPRRTTAANAGGSR